MIKNKIVSFGIEILIFFVLLGIFTLFPMNQITLQGSIIALSIYVFFASKHRKITLKQLGFELPSKDTVIKWLLLTLCMTFGIIFLKIIFPEGVFKGVTKNRQTFIYLIPFYVLAGSFFQEFVFRGYIFARTSKLFSVNTSIIINIILFSIFHLPYFIQYQSSLIYLSMIAGVCWSLMYSKYPNIYMVWISHGIIGSLNLLLLQKF